MRHEPKTSLATPAGARSRRRFLLAAGSAAAGMAIAPAAVAQIPPRASQRSTPLALMPQATRDAIRKVAGAAQLNRGKVNLELPQLVDNGNGVSLAVSVDSPMTDTDYVKAIHVFTEKNPQPNVISARLGPRAGRAGIATRIRLADTQTVVALCELSDGSFWYATADSVVTISSCLEEI
jgi:sulfur-oxidizing protein SoxY